MGLGFTALLGTSRENVGFSIRRILSYGQRPLVDLQKRPPWNFRFFSPGHIGFGQRL